MKDTNIYGVRYQLGEFCLIKFFLTIMKRHSTLTLIFFSSTERQSLTEASVTSDPASEAIRSRESVTREDIDAVSVCSITFTRSFVRSLFLWRFQPLPALRPFFTYAIIIFFYVSMICFTQKVTFGLALEKEFSVPFLDKSSVLLGPSLCAMYTIPWTIVVCYGYHTLDHRCVLWIPYL